MPQDSGATTCFVCRGVVYPNDSVNCACGRKFHGTCAKAVSFCPACGEELVIQKKKIRVLEVTGDKKEDERHKIKIAPKEHEHHEAPAKDKGVANVETQSIEMKGEHKETQREVEQKCASPPKDNKEDAQKLTPETCKVMLFRFMCLGVDVSWAQRQLELATEAIRNGNDIGAECLMREIKDSLEFDLNKNINDRIAKCRKFTDMMEHMIEGLDSILDGLQASKDCLFENKFEESIRHLERSESKLAPVKQKFEKDFIDGCKKLVESVQFADTDKKIKGIAENAIDALNQGQYYEALQFRDWLAREVAKAWPKISNVSIQKARRKFEEMSKTGMELSSAKMILEGAEAALLSGDHKKVVEYCSDLDAKLDKQAVSELDKAFSTIEKRLFEVERTGEDTSWARGILAYARTAQQMGEYSNAFGFIEKVKKKLGN